MIPKYKNEWTNESPRVFATQGAPDHPLLNSDTSTSAHFTAGDVREVPFNERLHSYLHICSAFVSTDLVKYASPKTFERVRVLRGELLKFIILSSDTSLDCRNSIYQKVDTTTCIELLTQLVKGFDIMISLTSKPRGIVVQMPGTFTRGHWVSSGGNWTSADLGKWEQARNSIYNITTFDLKKLFQIKNQD